MTALCIHLLGPFEVIRDGQPLTTRDWHSQQTCTILKTLLARHGRVVPADQLVEILWPGEDPSAARRRLYVRISQLRKALCPDGPTGCIHTIEGGYSFRADADCWVDAFEFERKARQGRCCQERGEPAEAIAAYETARELYSGDFLEEDLYEDWAFAERERLRERFLTVLTELPRADTSEEWADIYARMKEKLFPFMRPDARRWTARHFETFLDDASNFEYESVLTHSDFGTSNILFDAQSGRIQGIIDFGSSGLGDPAGDFAGLLSSYEEPFLRRCWATYPKIGSFWDRIHFYRGTFSLLEALFGIENDDQRAFEAGIAEYV